ncbi:MAG: aminoacyl-histidine dipeptidase [Bacteroidales bacterium]|nr:aminoacyl-histidine dipeptidase [Bacteroidales bacterium]HOI32964.1 aminoacyl-histidine dipeptidase [Bacteroidales bacterium]
MNEVLNTLEPTMIWKYFAEILQIPRPSKKEEKILAYLIDFAKKHHLEYEQDTVGNVLIKAPASPGFEKRKTVVLQSHVDMVCEKNSDTEHDFEKDPISVLIEDGWVKAKGTTLGADDGIGVAAQLALLADKSISRGAIECLFTVDEETGLTGAFGLEPDFLKGKILLNLDSEDEGELFIGCAGGKDTVITLPYKLEKAQQGLEFYRIDVKGLKGGHSGDDIHKGLANANKLLTRIVWKAARDLNVRMAHFEGGNLRNAIAREAFAIVAVKHESVDSFMQLMEKSTREMTYEYAVTEPKLDISIKPTQPTEKLLMLKEAQNKLLNSLYACPHGVIAWSQRIPNFVETSTNLASVRMENGLAVITTSQRSSVESSKEDIAQMVAACFDLIGAEVKHSNGYPGWAPDPNSEIRAITVEAYRDLFHQEPDVKAIHAGLECGLIGDKYPGMDMISYGPTIKGAHSPDERIQIETVIKFWDLTLEILKRIPDQE